MQRRCAAQRGRHEERIRGKHITGERPATAVQCEHAHEEADQGVQSWMGLRLSTLMQPHADFSLVVTIQNPRKQEEAGNTAPSRRIAPSLVETPHVEVTRAVPPVASRAHVLLLGIAGGLGAQQAAVARRVAGDIHAASPPIRASVCIMSVWRCGLLTPRPSRNYPARRARTRQVSSRTSKGLRRSTPSSTPRWARSSVVPAVRKRTRAARVSGLARRRR